MTFTFPKRRKGRMRAEICTDRIVIQARVRAVTNHSLQVQTVQTIPGCRVQRMVSQDVGTV